MPYCENTKICLYADDAAIFCQGKEIALVEKTLKCEFKKIVDHIEKDDLMLNIKKCKIMLFGTRKRIKNQSVRLIYRDNVIEVVNEFKYLGVLFDNCLKWDIHISKTVSKISRTISCIKRIKYYLPKRILKLLYDSLILSHIDYGIVLWGMFSKVSFGKVTKVTTSLCPFNTKRRYFDTSYYIIILPKMAISCSESAIPI